MEQWLLGFGNARHSPSPACAFVRSVVVQGCIGLYFLALCSFARVSCCHSSSCVLIFCQCLADAPPFCFPAKGATAGLDACEGRKSVIFDKDHQKLKINIYSKA